MGENRHDFFDVMSDEQQTRCVTTPAETLKKSEKMFARGRIQTRARFIEDEKAWARHQCATDEDALAFALAEDAPGAFGEMPSLDFA